LMPGRVLAYVGGDVDDVGRVVRSSLWRLSSTRKD
jgi:hypothetical protein